MALSMAGESAGGSMSPESGPCAHALARGGGRRREDRCVEARRSLVNVSRDSSRRT